MGLRYFHFDLTVTYFTGYFDAPNSKNLAPSKKKVWTNNFDSEDERKILEKVMTSARKEIEACDFYGGCVMIHSLAGGTGSGMPVIWLCQLIRSWITHSRITSRRVSFQLHSICCCCALLWR